MQCSQSENSKAADVKLAGRGQMIVLTLLEIRLSWKNHLFLCTCKSDQSVAGLGYQLYIGKQLPSGLVSSEFQRGYGVALESMELVNVRRSSLDAEVFKLASCGPAIMDEKATPSNGCFLRVKKLCHNPSFLSALMRSNTATRIKPEIAKIISLCCDIPLLESSLKLPRNGRIKPEIAKIISLCCDIPLLESSLKLPRSFLCAATLLTVLLVTSVEV
ncbi:hypothetical protein RHSIM_Rhsim03G0137700 [Rhododendron simsii]|uniref:Uncharacterized protein n=1 Tax=Rhododendron simsii TaxID=118357 RepID=A0A834HBM3_RHOSS|nr:hypothetical protein RHSIM_Rhsim03G0137700 [Rhododendron simsii]